jgi:hypothetical protein
LPYLFVIAASLFSTSPALSLEYFVNHRRDTLEGFRFIGAAIGHQPRPRIETRLANKEEAPVELLVGT